MRQFKSEGIVIKRKNYGEADRIITLFTKSQGKIQVKASGVRKITSRRSPHVELLNYSSITVYKGRAFPILIEAQVNEDFSGIKTDLTKVGLAYHICELVDGLCPENQEQEAVFVLLLNTLRQLNSLYVLPTATGYFNPENGLSDGDNTAVIIHEFEVELLSMLGYWHGTPELSLKLNTNDFIENIIERRLKSKRIFSKV